MASKNSSLGHILNSMSQKVAISEKQMTNDDVIKMWPQACNELLGFANHLRKTNSGITAAQLDMAIFLAQKYFNEVINKLPRPQDDTYYYAYVDDVDDELYDYFFIVEQEHWETNRCLGNGHIRHLLFLPDGMYEAIEGIFQYEAPEDIDDEERAKLVESYKQSLNAAGFVENKDILRAGFR